MKLYLPAAAEEQQSRDGAPAEARTVGGTGTILLAEDDVAVRALAQRVLERQGYRVLPANGGRAAIEIAREQLDAIDLLVSDVVMPEIGGPELAARLRELRPSLKVVFMSGYTEDAIINSDILGENSTFLAKPFSPDALARTVRGMLDPDRTPEEERGSANSGRSGG